MADPSQQHSLHSPQLQQNQQQAQSTPSTPSSQPTSSQPHLPQQQQHSVGDLNFSIQDILGDNGTSTNDSSFQNIVHDLNNNIPNNASYSHLPMELQHLFTNHGTDDLLSASASPSAGSDASSLSVSQQPLPWETPIMDDSQHSQQSLPHGATPVGAVASTSAPTMPSSVSRTMPPMSQSHASPAQPFVPSPVQATAQTPRQLPVHTALQQTPLQSPMQTPLSSATPYMGTPTNYSPAPGPASLQMSVPTPTPPPPQSIPFPTMSASPIASRPIIPTTSSKPQSTGAASMTLLDEITSQLSPERKEKFIALFRELQQNAVTADQFLSQAKMLLGQQQYQQLENLKNKPSPKPTPTYSESPERKRNVSSSQLRAEDAQRAMPGLGKRARGDTSAASKSPSVASSVTPTTYPPIPQHRPAGQAMDGRRLDYTNPTNALNYTGVNLKEESDQLLRDGDKLSAGAVAPPERAPTQGFLNSDLLQERLTKIASTETINQIDSDVLGYLALACQQRLRTLIEKMIVASKHRVQSQTVETAPLNAKGQTLYKVVDVQDIKKQLLAIERVEREEERKRKEAIAEKERRAQMGDGDHEGGDEDRPAKKKKKKEMGPGVTARNMSEDIRKKFTNETALMSAGGVRKSWMMAGLSGKGGSASLSSGGAGGGGGVGSSSSGGGGSSSVNATGSGSGHVSNPPPLHRPHPATPLGSSGTPPMQESPAEEAPRGRGRPRGRKAQGSDGSRRDRNRGYMGLERGDHGRSQDGGIFLPPSTIGRPRLGEQGIRRITMNDALFAIEKEAEDHRQTARRTLLKAYNQWLK
ncbi:transcription initiation factor TFIID component TAF4 family-domain-containing protein [Radiomyces spectabilis]|uniref:transcription initiation factor TFIID component TAF4 family-domain-containing protein n=1 Tax=Radiomyces spectabilis TaxID=64574 RepID=UPI0022204C26|nr:transcription initiation factor TFIID component TAF4 family-domain-containing protein [Radiomyces spectabilis]KAI8381433.1 transcription initiation factor TFIID component TAF4 family-domain-containing protein [Radiomyces spectabilis]